MSQLGPKQVGPFKVEHQIGLSAYQLELPPSFKIFYTFHECLLTPFCGYPDSKNSWFPQYDCYNSPDLIQEFYNRNPTAIGHPELTLAEMKPPPAHKNFSLSHLPDGGIVPQTKAEGNDMVGSIMPGIIQPSCKAKNWANC
ncbi:hypothetical protein DSO57_1035573 [Entomophthora muscae]|uniref:Uncharacterized protein n=1 Tax=Entomophthora muscae TaxID=34485 RepID=A0ACC2SNU5_9FUNG|nr:hypothetical protein DSO57_1035573 [Entomophthora muscae]